MKIKEILLSGFVFTTFDWCPPKTPPQLDYENMPEKPKMPAVVKFNDAGVPRTSSGSIANTQQIKAWNNFIVYLYRLDGYESIDEIKEKAPQLIIVKDINGNEIFI